LLKFRRFIILLAFVMVLAAPPLSQAQEEQKFLLTFIPNIQFSPLYAGIENGAFGDLDITIEYLNEPDVVDLIAAGQEQFGMVSGEQVILARARGRDVVYVYEWFQQYPIGVVAPAGTSLESAADLAGLRVGIPGRFGATYSGFTALLMSGEMAENEVQLEEIGFNAPDVFCLGAIDASVIYVNNEPLQIQNRAEQGECAEIEGVEVLPISTIADLVSNGVITSAAMIEFEPERVQAIVNGFDAGLKAVINNPARAYLISLDYVENLPADEAFIAALTQAAEEQDAFLAAEPEREAIIESRVAMRQTLGEQFDNDTLIQFDVLLASIDLWDAEQPGFSDMASWETMQNTLLEMEILTEAIDLEAVYTNAFLPPVE